MCLKKIIYKSIKKLNVMKKKNYLVTLCGALLLSAFVLFSCEEEDNKVNPEDICHEKDELWCDDEKGRESGCCENDTPWSDGHGTCYSSQSYCTASGWPCIKCW
jgi:hypothetical protein